MSLRHPYDSNIAKKCFRRLTPTSVLLTPQVLTRIPILNINTEVLKRGSYELEWFGNFGVIWAYHSEYTMEITFDLVWFGNIILNIPDVTVVFHMVTSYYPPSQQSVSVSQEIPRRRRPCFWRRESQRWSAWSKDLIFPGTFFRRQRTQFAVTLDWFKRIPSNIWASTGLLQWYILQW